MSIFIDQMLREVEIKSKPQRIISLVPSQTELLYHLGLQNEICGITKFCVHPHEWYINKTKVGGTKKINFNVIASLKPDLIIGNKEENLKEEIEQLMQHYTVWMSDVNTLQQATAMIKQVAEITQTNDKGQEIVQQIEKEFQRLKNFKSPYKNVAYFIWINPLMVVGQNNIINSIIKELGLKNIFEQFDTLQPKSCRYPQISEEELIKQNPELILLSTEPYPFSEKHIPYFKKLCPNAKILIVDGEMFSWYGSRLALTPQYLIDVLG
ncbi:MAG: ABC transporter substrate-binding protein [Bacteroidia bacterium]|nr:ABC transporter substrate-binding protein [Bacteroidia bacterium]MCZ2247994.1 helical backbone metal receptor [Bacteroidia bacterium]